MSKLIIRNKNRYIYGVKSRIREYIHSNALMLKTYLKLKESIIKNSMNITNSSFNKGELRGIFFEDSLFEKVFIETISYCNNDCAFCPASTNTGVKTPQSLMPEDLYLKIINELSGLSFTGSIAFHCNNEPLLDKRLVSWINIARRTLKNNFFYLYTNGILINTDLTNQLFEAGLNRIIIDNYDDDLRLLPSVRDIIDNQSALRGEVIINYRFKNEFLGNRAGQSPNTKVFLKDPLKIICLRPSKEIVIGHDGTIPLCCADGLRKVVVGNVQETPLKDIWFSDYFKRIRKNLVNRDRSCTEICESCDALNFSAPKGIRQLR
ncbi:MAG: radical SAM/SPASM domain-containing protein [Candidatus Omnitrophota bacterium]